MNRRFELTDEEWERPAPLLPTSVERQELSALRQENRRLREDVEILKRATAFFVKETR